MQMDGINPFYYEVSPLSFTLTDIHAWSNNGHMLDMQGTFTYNLDGSFADGVVSGVVDYYQGIPAVVIGGLDVDARILLAHLANDPTLVTFWQSVLGGGDIIEGGNGGPNRLFGFGAGGDYIVGGSSYDVLQGFGGNNTILGTGAADRINGGPGVNVLVGGARQTAFDFFALDYPFSDVITNFKPGTRAVHDVLWFHSEPGLHNFAQVLHHAVVDRHHHDVVIHDNIGDHIILANIHNLAQLHPYDFLFVA
jgi:Ca2+-binding RTX toxin-like protein